MAFITPISWVLSFTVSVMTLYMPIAPTIRDMEPMPARAYLIMFSTSSTDSNLVVIASTL